MGTNIWFLEIRRDTALQWIVKEWHFFGTEREAISQARLALAFSLKTSEINLLVVVTGCNEHGQPCLDTVYQGNFGLTIESEHTYQVESYTDGVYFESVDVVSLSEAVGYAQREVGKLLDVQHSFITRMLIKRNNVVIASINDTRVVTFTEAKHKVYGYNSL